MEYGSAFQSRTASGKYSIWPQITCPGSQFIEFSLNFQVWCPTLFNFSQNTPGLFRFGDLCLCSDIFFHFQTKKPQHIQGVPSCRPQVDSTDHSTYGEALRSFIWWRIALTFDVGFQEVLKKYYPKTVLAALLWKSGQT